MIAIVNYGVGNLTSIYNMLRKISVDAVITSDTGEITRASRIILPGVGAFDHCMQMFNASGLRELVTRRALEEGVPTLGICVGMQMLTGGSEEGKEPGLNWIAGKTVRFSREKVGALKIPHMGWTDVSVKKSSGMVADFSDDFRFYFVHSYHVVTDDPADILLTAEYGYPFTAAVEKANIRGVQFHPEKSHRFGMQLLQNFATTAG
jgi:glutamine amidotransferase